MTSDLETVSAETQGISADWSRADGVYDAMDRGRLDHGGLLEVLRKAQPLSVPDKHRMDDYCPPHLMTNSDAGAFNFMFDGGAIFCEQTECEVSPAEAADMATGRASAAAVAARHAGESGKAFLQGPEKARVEAEQKAIWQARRTEATPKPIGGFRKLIGYLLAFCFLVVGFGVIGGGMDAASGGGSQDDLYAALVIGGLLMVVGLLIAWAVRKAGRRGGGRRRGRGGRTVIRTGGRDDDRYDDDRDRDRDDRQDDDDGDDGGDTD